MRTTTTLSTLLLITAALGCEHKSKRDDQPSQSGMTDTAGKQPVAAAKPADMAAEPVAKDPAAPPQVAPVASPTAPGPAPTGGANDVRPPVAADLAEYTKDIKGTGKLVATISTNKGDFHCELFPDKAPMTVANFIGLATGKKAWMNPKTGSVETGKPFYAGLTFHRVIPQFMIQGGDPTGTGAGGPGYAFNDEVDGGPPFQIGSLAMANAGIHGGQGTNGSQFFITEIAPTWLNGHHTIFGQCKEVDTVKAITALRGPGDKPSEPVTINKITFAR